MRIDFRKLEAAGFEVVVDNDRGLQIHPREGMNLDPLREVIGKVIKSEASQDRIMDQMVTLLHTEQIFEVLREGQ